MEQGKWYHVAMSVDADRHTDAYLRKHILPCIRPTYEHPELFRRACRAMREKGFDVFPPCDNTDERGYCAGHATPPAREGKEGDNGSA